MISRPPSVRRLDPFEPQFSKIERIDKRVDHSNRIGFVDPVVQAFRKQGDLSAIRPLNEALHPIPRMRGFSHSQGRSTTSVLHLRLDVSSTPAS